MHNNAPAHASNHTKHFLQSQGLHRWKLMVWPPNSSGLNPIDNLCGIVKGKIYSNGRQYNLCDVLGNAVKIACSSVTTSEVQNLINSVDKRVIKVLESGKKKIDHNFYF